jgi:hypothetical protein
MVLRHRRPAFPGFWCPWSIDQSGSLAISRQFFLETGLVGHDNCYTCLLLEDYYRLKVNDYALAAAAAPWSHLIGPVPINDDLCLARSLALEAAQALLKHWKTCQERRRAEVA